MSTNDFPSYFAHRDARCFACGGILLDLSPSKNAPGRGHYRGQCAACKKTTHYDCAEGTVEMIETREAREAEAKRR